MLKEVKKIDIEIEGTQEFFIEGTGSLIKIMIEFKEVDSLLRVQLFTKEGEKILDILNQKKTEVFYPRVNTITEKMGKGAALHAEGSTNLERYYFLDGLYLTASSQAKSTIKKISIIYEC